MKKMNNKGFSLVELIVVIAIMAVLVGVLAPQFIKYVESSRRSTDVSNAQNIQSAVLADIAEGKITGSGTNKTVTLSGGEMTPSTLGEIPKIKGNVDSLKGQDFYYSYSAPKGTCDVYADSGSAYCLTNESGVSKYKNK